MTTVQDTEKPKLKRRWLRFSLRSFLLSTLVLCVFLAWVGKQVVRVHHQRVVVAKITTAGGTVTYSYQYASGENGQTPPGPKWLRWIFGDDIFADVGSVSFYQKGTDADVALLEELPRLTGVSLGGQQFSNKSIQQVAKISTLTTLNLSDTSITADGLAQMSAAKSFRGLVLYGPEITDDLLRALDSLPHLELLQLLRTHHVTSAGVAHVARLKGLKDLFVSDDLEFDDAAAAHVAGLANLESLQFIKTSVTDEGLEHLKDLHRLKLLDLQLTHISGHGLKCIIAMPALTSLNVQSTGIGDGGLRLIGRLHSLTWLDVSGTKVTNAGMIDVAKLENLERLDIDETEVSDIGILQLKTLRTLKTLSVGPKVTIGAAKELAGSVPGLRIQRWQPRATSNFRVVSDANGVIKVER